MALLEETPMPSVTGIATDVFEKGTSLVQSFSIRTSSSSSPPKPLLIFTPVKEGNYPVLLFLHGTSVPNSSYTQLLEHIASHGFISIAPQLYTLLPPCGETEIADAVEVTNWLSTGLQSVLPEKVEANLLKLALAGHSRGGKAAFSLALGQGSKPSLNFSLLLGIDPVAGKNKCYQVSPKILTFEPRSFNLGIPVLVLGTGLGSQRLNIVACPCAPKNVSHEEFYNECQPPRYHFVPKDYGHMDMLDDDPKCILGKITSSLCKSGEGERDPMRRCVGGIVVAFLRDYFESERGDLEAIISDPGIAPVKLDPIDYDET